MPLTTHLLCHLWDLEDEGIDPALDRIQGDLGAQGLTVPVTHPGLEQLRSHDGVRPRWFRSAGGLQFQPDLSAYRSTRARPLVAEWLKKRNPLAKVSEACRDRGLTLHAWLDCCDSAAMVAANPALATKDAFGEPSARWMCPRNPDVCEYLRALVGETVRMYGCTAIELDAWLAPHFAGPPPPTVLGFSPDAVTALLLCLCFCESCRQATARDGIDIAAAERAARLDLERTLHTGGDERRASLDDYLGTHQAIRNLLDWRREGIARLVRDLRHEAGSATVRVVLPPPATADLTLLRQVGPAGGGVCVPLEHADEGLTRTAVRLGAETAPGADRTWLAVDARTPPVRDAADLVRNLNLAAELGAAGAHVMNYGMIAPSRLPWVKQAIRYARRNA